MVAAAGRCRVARRCSVARGQAHPGPEEGAWRPAYEILSEKYPHLIPEHEPLCIPSVPCHVRTPHGDVDGLSCPAASEFNHNTYPHNLPKIAADGELRPGERDWVLGQDVISLSSCPAQHFGGNLKLVFDAPSLLKARKLRPMCYYDHEAHRGVDRALDEEANGPRDGSVVGTNRVKARYGVAPMVLYPHECEWISDDAVPLEGNLRRVEYWISSGPDTVSTSCGDPGQGPRYANQQDWPYFYREMKRWVGEGRRIAGERGVPFRVRSCYPLLYKGFGEYVELTQGNMDELARGGDPPAMPPFPGGLYSEENTVRYRCRC